MRHGYILVTKSGPSPEAQRAALSAAGVGPTASVQSDAVASPERTQQTAADLTGRRAAIKMLEKGDELVVATPGCLGVSTADILSVLRQVSARGASVFVASRQERIACTPEALAVVALCEEAAAERRKAHAARMRQAIREGKDVKVGRNPITLDARAREIWADPTKSAAEAAAAIGVSARTLYRRLGPKDAPKGEG